MVLRRRRLYPHLGPRSALSHLLASDKKLNIYILKELIFKNIYYTN